MDFSVHQRLEALQLLAYLLVTSFGWLALVLLNLLYNFYC